MFELYRPGESTSQFPDSACQGRYYSFVWTSSLLLTIVTNYIKKYELGQNFKDIDRLVGHWCSKTNEFLDIIILHLFTCHKCFQQLNSSLFII